MPAFATHPVVRGRVSGHCHVPRLSSGRQGKTFQWLTARDDAMLGLHILGQRSRRGVISNRPRNLPTDRSPPLATETPLVANGEGRKPGPPSRSPLWLARRRTVIRRLHDVRGARRPSTRCLLTTMAFGIVSDVTILAISYQKPSLYALVYAFCCGLNTTCINHGCFCIFMRLRRIAHRSCPHQWVHPTR